MLLQRLLLLSLTGLIHAVYNEEFREPKILNIDNNKGKIKNVFNTEVPSGLSKEGERVVGEISGWLSQLIYRPVIVLLNDKEGLLEDAGKYLNGILKNPNVRNDFWLMKFNSSGVTGVLGKTSAMDLNDFMSLLKSGIREEKLQLGGENKGATVFFSILKATRILQSGAGILIFTDEKIQDEDLAQLAIKEILRKQIKVFGVWNGGYPSVNDEERLLRELSMLSKGFFFVGNTERKVFNEYYWESDNAKSKAIVAHKSNIRGLNILNVPIDKGVTSIHVSLTGAVNRARFASPNGYLIDLLNVTDVGSFSRGSYCVKFGEIYDIQLNTAHNTPTPVVGIWRLETDAFAQHNVTISIQNRLILTTQIDQNKRGTLRLDLQGDFGKINNISVVDKFGQPFDKKLEYHFTDSTKESMEIETFREKEFDLDLQTVPQQPLYIKVDGKDLEGNDFVRLSYFNPHNSLPGATIDLKPESELLLTPNQRSKILFEVTNNKNQVTFFNFQCNDDKRLLVSMQPSRLWMNPQQTVTVTISIYARRAAGVNYRDFVTFTAVSGAERYVKQALVDVNNNRVLDSDEPKLSHKYTSDCLNVNLDKCETGTWNVEVTAQDKESGLLTLTSYPAGLHFPNGFTTGTTELVTGRYSGSCCYPELELTAVDRSKNRIMYRIDAYKAALGPGAIAAIVLGVLLIIAIIVGIVLLCKCGKCKRKQKGSMDLPTTSYRGPINSASTTRY